MATTHVNKYADEVKQAIENETESLRELSLQVRIRRRDRCFDNTLI